MMKHAWGGASPPLLYAQHTYVKGLGLRWDEVRAQALSSYEIGLLVEMVNVAEEASRIKADVKAKARKR